MDEENIDEFNFQADECEKQVTEIIDSTLQGQIYNEQQVPHWINIICEKVMEYLINGGQQGHGLKPYKYMINCMVMQKIGAPAICAASTYWDSGSDGCIIVKWPKDKESKGEATKNQANCIVTVFASCLNTQH
ncbi:hypothetical protein PPERSA_02426 [Pseudocohnilembus persalinus]|uniref:Dynein light chain n=1 Tax=Pseudocohnilembus persalinus TaxID=266149 RepID=A0A0V0QAU4_PSEPJ|nr:hypothetical protein PPERSA_02426 [Pseudocohnilembus persalinus]|eukprot:KRW99314.1 hypothetical protein PPERSA_02426 [Pseudocohnilembus persalinus]